MLSLSAIDLMRYVTVGVVLTAAVMTILLLLRELGWGALVKSALSEDDGSTSMSRLSCFLSLLATIGWVTYVVVTTHTIPVLSNCATFITAGNIPYVVNRAHNYLTSK